MNLRLRRGYKSVLSAMIVLAALAATGEAKTFRWANDGDPTTMDPHARGDAFVSSFDFNMYEALVRRDRNLKPNRRSRPNGRTSTRRRGGSNCATASPFMTGRRLP